MVTINHKRGDTFELACSIPLDFGLSLTSTTAQIRRNGELVTQLALTAGSPTLTEYKYTISATALQTALWVVGEHLVDIQYTIGSKVASTETFAVLVVEDVTR